MGYRAQNPKQKIRNQKSEVRDEKSSRWEVEDRRRVAGGPVVAKQLTLMTTQPDGCLFSGRSCQIIGLGMRF